VLARLQAWLLERLRPAPPVTLRLYTKRDCPLCSELRAALARARLAARVRLEEVDIEGDARLRERYGLSVPVLELEGRTLAKGRARVEELERRFARLLAEIRAERLSGATARRESRHG
jgi:glutaredoxin